MPATSFTSATLATKPPLEFHMSSFKEHCEESEKLFGKPFPEVHRWLDEFAGSERYGMRHRKLRHHEAGVREARQRFGEEAARAARQHIISDLMMEGWRPGVDRFPQDQQDYERMGLF